MRAQEDLKNIVVLVMAAMVIVAAGVEWWLNLKQGVELADCKLTISKIGLSNLAAGIIEVENSCKVKPVTIDAKNPKEAAVEIVKNHLYRCWDITKGRQSPLGVRGFAKDQDTCFVCTQFTLNTDLPVSSILPLFDAKASTGVDYATLLESDWKASDYSQYFADIVSGEIPSIDTSVPHVGPGNKDVARFERLTLLKKETNYLSVFTFHQEPLIELYTLPSGWSYESSDPESIKLRHVFVIPATDFLGLDCDRFIWAK